MLIDDSVIKHSIGFFTSLEDRLVDKVFQFILLLLLYCDSKVLLLKITNHYKTDSKTAHSDDTMTAHEASLSSHFSTFSASQPASNCFLENSDSISLFNARNDFRSNETVSDFSKFAFMEIKSSSIGPDNFTSFIIITARRIRTRVLLCVLLFRFDNSLFHLGSKAL